MKWKTVLIVVASLLLLAIPVALTVGAAPENGITSPASGEAVKGEVTIMGTATDPSFWKYELHYGPDPNPDGAWSDLLAPKGYAEMQVVEGELGKWDTSMVEDGVYTLKLRIVRSTGQYDDLLVEGIEVANTGDVEPPADEPADAEPADTEPADAEPTAAATEEPEEAEEPAAPVETKELEVPFEEMWAGSPHADASAEAFRHWDEDDPAVVPANCAKCHSEGGFQDFVGADGSEPGVVDADHDINTVVSCVACHNSATVSWDTVVFPSGSEISGLGSEARCMECHQGRASTVSVNTGIEEAGIEDMDTVSEDLGFTNIHYFAAAASMYGTLAQGGYQYDGNSYDGKFDHVDGANTCVDCHSPHSLELRADACASCHSEGDFKDVRMAGSLVDYDGDGDVEEGIYYEIETLQEMLYGAMQAYGAEVAGTPIAYNSHAYPYFFIDTNADGEAGEDEAVYPNAYNAWTGRLAKAAYNYQTSLKDPGGYAHGGKYMIQLLYDSIEDLNEALSEPVDLSNANRIDHGHFAGSEEAFRHWDEDGAVSGSCSTCHSSKGLPFFLTEGAEVTQPISNGLQCETCHNDLETYTLYEVGAVEFPSGASVDSGDPSNNLCLNCHQGRSSTVQVDSATEGMDKDTVSEDLGFINVHYFAAAATLFGDEVKGAYQYEGKEYAGKNEHVPGFANCTECHSAHKLEVKAEECTTCHAGIEDVADIRMDSTDYDGDGDTSAGIGTEIAGVADALYVCIQGYAADTAGTPIVYDSHAYPYFFTDTNANGESDPDEANYGNQYATWTPAMLKAAYNYQYAQKDPGAGAHNAKYVLQALYDSAEDLGCDVSGLARP